MFETKCKYTDTYYMTLKFYKAGLSGGQYYMKDEFIELYRGVYKDLYKYALYILGNREDAEDTVSETVVDAYAGFEKLRDKGAFKSWIFKILSIKCKMKLKGYVNKSVCLDETLDSQVYKDAEDVVGRVDLQTAFSKLDDRERQIIALSVIAGYEGEEVSKLMNMNHNTVRTVKSRALEKMRKMLR